MTDLLPFNTEVFVHGILEGCEPWSEMSEVKKGWRLKCLKKSDAAQATIVSIWGAQPVVQKDPAEP